MAKIDRAVENFFVKFGRKMDDLLDGYITKRYKDLTILDVHELRDLEFLIKAYPKKAARVIRNLDTYVREFLPGYVLEWANETDGPKKGASKN